MNVFIGMEESQTIQQAFEAKGHNSWSCDLKPARLNPSRHIQGDVHEVLRSLRWTPDIIILHPVCRFLTVSGQHWIGRPGQEDRGQRKPCPISCGVRSTDPDCASRIRSEL